MRFASDLRKKIIDDYYLCSCSRVVWRSLPNGMPSNGFPQRRELRQSNGAGAAGYERFWCRPVPTPWWWVGALGNAGDYLKLRSIKGVRYTWLSYSWLHPELTMKRSLLPDGWATVCAVCRAPVGENATVNLGSSRLTSCSGCGSWTYFPRPTPGDQAKIHDDPDYFDHPYFELRRRVTPVQRRRCRDIFSRLSIACGLIACGTRNGQCDGRAIGN